MSNTVITDNTNAVLSNIHALIDLQAEKDSAKKKKFKKKSHLQQQEDAVNQRYRATYARGVKDAAENGGLENVVAYIKSAQKEIKTAYDIQKIQPSEKQMPVDANALLGEAVRNYVKKHFNDSYEAWKEDAILNGTVKPAGIKRTLLSFLYK